MLISWGAGKLIFILLVISFLSGNAANVLHREDWLKKDSPPGQVIYLPEIASLSPEKSQALKDTALTFSEIMFYAPAANSEFIELYNLSARDSIDLKGYLIKYYTSNPDTIKNAGHGTKLGPNQFAVIFEADYDISGGIYKAIIPSDALILKIADNSFGSNGMANTADRPVSLLSPAGDTIETYTYSVSGNQEGFSDEKIFLSKNNSMMNWKNCLRINGTPGTGNSVSPPAYDLAVERCYVTPENTSPGSPVVVTSVIKNRGALAISNYMLILYLDKNHDTLPQQNEWLYQSGSLPLQYLDSAVFKYNFTVPDTGSYCFMAKAWTPQDYDTSNNISHCWCHTYSSPFFTRDVIINEIMYAPQNGEPEWIELYNRSSSPVNIKGFTFSDAMDTVVLTSSEYSIAPYGYVVVSRDSSIKTRYPFAFSYITAKLPIMNNDQDRLSIRDAQGRTKDSLAYNASWGGQGGRSLERMFADSSSVYQSNWKTCQYVFNGTPGMKNSATPKNINPAVTEINLQKNPVFENEPITCTVKILNKGLMESGSSILYLYVDINNDSLPQTGELKASKDIQTLQAGDSVLAVFTIAGLAHGDYRLITVLYSVNDEDTTDNTMAVIQSIVKYVPQAYALIINEIMYAPSGSEPEWIELYNKSSYSINLRNCHICDARDTNTITTKDYFIPPESYLVVTKDSLIKNIYPYRFDYITAGLPILNNDKDHIAILDSLYRTEDSLTYNYTWGGAAGRSLERISVDSVSFNPLNWSTCLSDCRGTPGRKNSVTRKDRNIAIQKLTFRGNPVSETDNIVCDFILKNTGKYSVTQVNAGIYIDMNNDSLPQQSELFMSETIDALQPDSCSERTFVLTSRPRGAYLIMLAIWCEGDEDSTDNLAHIVLYVTAPAARRNEVAINEIMFAPLAGEAEWLELYNRSGREIELKSFCIADAVDTVRLSRNSCVISPNSYLVVASDSGFIKKYPGAGAVVVTALPQLNNTGDRIMLLDSVFMVIDSLEYTGHWGGKPGTSIERVSVDSMSSDSANWRPNRSSIGASPGKVNSISKKNYDICVADVKCSPLYPLRGQTVKIGASIVNMGNSSAPPLSMAMKFLCSSVDSFEVALNISALQPGEEKSVTTEQVMKSDAMKISCMVNWEADEYMENNRYDLAVECSVPPAAIVISEIMNSPKAAQPQWVEIYNRSSDTVNLQDWKISDMIPSLTSAYITRETLSLGPSEYFIIARDSMPAMPVHSYSRAGFGQLNATDDGVVITDNHGQVMDSVRYKPDWSLLKYRSIEKRDVNGSSTDKDNWHFSILPECSSPLKQNSAGLQRPAPKNALIINEIMYEPGSGNSEYVEIFNRSNDECQIAGFRVKTPGHTYFLEDTVLTLHPKEYFVLFSDSSLLLRHTAMQNNPLKFCSGTANLGLDNSGVAIMLTDAYESIIDSLYFQPAWHLKNAGPTVNRSLERINPDESGTSAANWSTCTSQEGGTPGRINSIHLNENLNSTALEIQPNPFSPDNDGFEDVTMLQFSLPFNSALITIRIYDDKGRLMRRLISDELNSGRGTIVYNGRDDNGNPLRLGMYIILFEAADAVTGRQIKIKKILVSARKL